MKKYLIILFLSVSVCLAGCFTSPSSAEETSSVSIPYTAPNYEDMEIYQFLSSNIAEDASLDEMLDTFSEMCKIPVDTQSDMFLYEVYPYESDGISYIGCHIVRQVDEPGTFEYIQLHMDITYLSDTDIADFHESIWFERDADAFIQYIKKGEIYQVLAAKPISHHHISIYSTW